MVTTNTPSEVTGRSPVWKLAAASLFGLAGLVPAVAEAVHIMPQEAYVNDVNYMEFTINHHFAALRMTELAAGTSAVGSTSNFGGSPQSFPATEAKGTNPVVLSVATEANASQRMQIVEMQNMLSADYGVTGYDPFVMPQTQPLLDTLNAAAPGDAFNVAFLQLFSEHHAILNAISADCVAQSPNAQLRDLCSMTIDEQSRQIDQMQTELRVRYGIEGGVEAGGGATAVPEPASFALLGVGLLGLGVARGRKKAATREAAPVA